MNIELKSEHLSEAELEDLCSHAEFLELSERAWEVRERSYSPKAGKHTSVGCAVMDDEGNVFIGTNIKHRFNITDPHAEMVALFNMVAAGGASAVVLFVAAERLNFVPCGRCMDWAYELGAKSTKHIHVKGMRGVKTIEESDIIICSQAHREATITVRHFRDLMPLYPY